MKLLANENIPGIAVEALRNAGHDICWARQTMPGSPDDKVLARARREERILLTLDKDFGELVYRRGLASAKGIVLVRIPFRSPESVGQYLVELFQQPVEWAGHFVVTTLSGLRMLALPG